MIRGGLLGGPPLNSYLSGENNGSSYDLDNVGDKEIFVTNGNASHRDPEAPDF